MSAVNLFRCREDINGNGAELSRPKRERMSWRMTLTSSGSLVEVCSFSRAGMLFWPTYLVISTVSGSTRRIRQAAGDRTQPTRVNTPYALMDSRASLLWLRDSCSSGECGLFLVCELVSEKEPLLPVAERLGL